MLLYSKYLQIHSRNFFDQLSSLFILVGQHIRQFALLTKNIKYNFPIVNKNYLTPQKMSILRIRLEHGIATQVNCTPYFAPQLIENELYASLYRINSLRLIEKFFGKRRTIHLIYSQ